MNFDVETAQKDCKNMDIHSFFEKYYLSKDTWYIEEYLQYSGKDAKSRIELYKTIIASIVDVNPEDVFMIGSAKLGFSLSPSKSETESKLFKPFDGDGVDRKKSDIDIAIVSSSLFDKFWKLYRKSYNWRYRAVYDEHIIRETYRGFVNENNIQLIDGTRREWNSLITPAKVQLMRNVGFRHEVNFRVYQSLFDFEDYSNCTIREIKKGL